VKDPLLVHYIKGDLLNKSVL